MKVEIIKKWGRRLTLKCSVGTFDALSGENENFEVSKSYPCEIGFEEILKLGENMIPCDKKEKFNVESNDGVTTFTLFLEGVDEEKLCIFRLGSNIIMAMTESVDAPVGKFYKVILPRNSVKIFNEYE